MLETNRLRLRPISRDDLATVVALNSHPDAVQFMEPNTPWTEADARVWLERHVERLATLGFGAHLMERKSDGAIVGRVGIATWLIEGEHEVGYLLGREYWGHGYATEAARAMRDHAFLTHGVGRVISIIDNDNKRSAAVARRNGMTPGYEREWYGGTATIWAISRAHWETRQATGGGYTVTP